MPTVTSPISPAVSESFPIAWRSRTLTFSGSQGQRGWTKVPEARYGTVVPMAPTAVTEMSTRRFS
jgi:hypothetical protein